MVWFFAGPSNVAIHLFVILVCVTLLSMASTEENPLFLSRDSLSCAGCLCYSIVFLLERLKNLQVTPPSLFLLEYRYFIAFRVLNHNMSLGSDTYSARIYPSTKKIELGNIAKIVREMHYNRLGLPGLAVTFLEGEPASID